MYGKARGGNAAGFVPSGQVICASDGSSVAFRVRSELFQPLYGVFVAQFRGLLEASASVFRSVPSPGPCLNRFIPLTLPSLRLTIGIVAK